MKRYTNTHAGAVRSVDVTRSAESLRVCLQLKNQASNEPVKSFLNNQGYTLISDTIVNGRPILIASGPRNESQFIHTLSSFDGRFEAAPEKKPFDAWKIRSYLGFGGQILQLSSSFMKKNLDLPIASFAVANLTANGINLAYKAQKRDDTQQLIFLKKQINEQLAPQLPDTKTALHISDNRAFLREQSRPKPGHAFNKFMQKNSVNVGELGLRYFGAFSLAFPAGDWKSALREGRLPKADVTRPLRMAAGLGSMFGKTIATTSLIPDPYNPSPPSTMQKLREKYSFLTGGLVEAVAFSTLAWDAWSNSKPVIENGLNTNKHSIKIGGKYSRDWVGTLGSAMFVCGYIVRSWAKFGQREVNMPELYAHTSDTLAMLPSDKIPQALADTSAYLANHFKDKAGFTFSEIYDKISDDLATEHHITVTPSAHKREALAVAVNPRAEETELAPSSPHSKITLQKEPSASHTERLITQEPKIAHQH